MQRLEVSGALGFIGLTILSIMIGLRLNCTHRLLVCAAIVNILGGSVRTIEQNTEALVVASKVIGLEVNAEKTK